MLVDSSCGEILPAMAEELAVNIGEKIVKAKAAPAEKTSMTELNDAYVARQLEQEEGKEPASKKLKTVDPARLYAYGKYQDMKVAGLGDILQWNHQYKTGNKDYLMEKVIDGEVYGRLAQCPVCSSKLKLTEGTVVVCIGPFDEDTQRKMQCAYQAKPSDAPRWKPWYVQDFRSSRLTIIVRHSRVLHSASPVFHSCI
jgi:hypothetical protein